MARYQKPSDPDDRDLRPRRPRFLRADAREPVPWIWLGLGVIVTIVGIGLALTLANLLLSREPLVANVLTPTVIRLTAPPTVPPTATVLRPTPSPIPTFTPAPTRDLSRPPVEITVGYYAAVVGTGEAGLTVRGGPSTDSARLMRASEGTLMRVLGGPEEGGDYAWWQVRLVDGTEGWVAGQFIEPAAAPEE